MLKLKKVNKLIWLLVIVIAFVVFCATFPYKLFYCCLEGVAITDEELSELLSKNKYLSTKIVKQVDNFNELEEIVVEYNLFNMFNITSLRVDVVNDNEVLLGGDCLGISLNSKGLTVIGSNYVITKDGVKHPFATSSLKVGDTILKINDVEVCNADDIEMALSKYKEGVVTLLVKRNEEIKNYTITPALDMQTNTYKLGLWVKNDVSGVGTLTYIKTDDLRFGALGHSINKNGGDDAVDISGGNIYNARVIGVKEGQRGVPGELLGLFSQSEPQGNIDKNIKYGIFGNVNENSSLITDKANMEVGGRMSAKAGKAQIASTISGDKVEYFDIELIKVNYQSNANEKSMVFRVTDEDLLNKTGGIVQGMSGSPIIQDGKIIGAVTHVFVNDPTKGFGVYIDWMINE